MPRTSEVEYAVPTVPRPILLGDALVKLGYLTKTQRDLVAQQQEIRAKPFGVLAEEMFGVKPGHVEQAWAVQFAELTETVDPRYEDVQPAALAEIGRRQAWQFEVLPLRYEGGSLLAASSRTSVARALRFTGWRLARPVRFLIAESHALNEALGEHYPLGPRVADG